MKFLHSMIRVRDLDESLDFYCNKLGLKELRRKEVPAGRFTLVFLAADSGGSEIELTYNWDAPESYGNARNFGHLAFSVDNIYETCESLQKNRALKFCDHQKTVTWPLLKVLMIFQLNFYKKMDL